MQDDGLRRHTLESGLSPNTASTRIAALRRIERSEGIDLDKEFDRDELQGLLNRYQYTIEDLRNGRANPSQIDIEPEKLNRDLAFYRTVIQAYRAFRAGNSEILDEQVDGPGSPVAEAVRTFGLERDLQVALRANIQQLEAGLEIVDGGAEAKVDAGFIDILAKDGTGAWVVIELKAELTRPAAVAQILAYMGCVAADRGGNVRGILVGADFDQRVEFAARAVPNLTLKRYRFRFEFV
jgi:hypothetical protein